MDHVRRLLAGCFVLGLLLAGGGPVSVQAQQVLPIAEARQQGGGATVTVEGTVTRAFGDFVRIQDESGSVGASGLTIRQTSGGFADVVESGDIARDTVLQVTGTLSEFNGLLQINEDDLADYETRGVDASPPTPLTVDIPTLRTNGEAYESVLVRVDGLTFSGRPGAFEANTTYLVVAAASGENIDLRVQGSDESAVAGTEPPRGAFDYTGVVGQFDPQSSGTGYQLIPVRPDDFQAAPSILFPRSFTIGDETSGSASFEVAAVNVPSGTSVSANLSVDTGESSAENGVDVTNLPATLSFTGSETRTVTVSLADDGQDEGVEDLRLQLSSSDAAVATPARHALWILDEPGATTTLFPDLTGEELLSRLEQEFGGAETLGYDVARDTLYDTVFNDGGTVESYYAGLQVPRGTGDASEAVGSRGINTEHTYPQSRGSEDEPAKSDMHILVPARGEVNTARSNYPFGEVSDPLADRWFIGDETVQTPPPRGERDAYSEVDDSPSDRSLRRFEPREAVKGNVARKVLYFRIAYPDLTDGAFLQDQLTDLLRWNSEDPPDAQEVRRNAAVATYQGPLNPFVLDPSLAIRAFAPDGISVPDRVVIDAFRSFEGIETAAGYELVALPGDIERPIAQTLGGTEGRDWKVLWDTGATEDFLIDYENTEQFEFRPGRGFWLISRNDWSVGGLVESVPVENGTAGIDLHDGWNIISNPLDLDAAWANVEAANGGRLQPIWAWEDGTWTRADTLASAVSGDAFYFLNDQGIDRLSIPYPALSPPKTASAPDSEITARIRLEAVQNGESVARTDLVLSPEAARGADPRDQVAPPAAFAPVRLVVDGSADRPRRERWLAQDARPASAADGATYRLRLRKTTDEPVRIDASIDGDWSQSLVLVDSTTGREVNLREESMTLDGEAGPRSLALRVGAGDSSVDNSLPTEVMLQDVYPNPVRSEATFVYDLPESGTARLEIFDLLGRKVATVANGRRSAGRHEATWTVGDVSSGVYLARFNAAGRSIVRKIVVVQ